jgi:hypothetical protein
MGFCGDMQAGESNRTSLEEQTTQEIDLEKQSPLPVAVEQPDLEQQPMQLAVEQPDLEQQPRQSMAVEQENPDQYPTQEVDLEQQTTLPMIIEQQDLELIRKPVIE